MPNTTCIVDTLHDIAPMYVPSGQEQELIYYASEKLDRYGFDIEIDDLGNIMATRYGKKKTDPLPLLSAHSDTVQQYRDKTLLDSGRVGFEYNEEYQIFYSPTKDYYSGFDDKVGVAIILCLARNTDLPFKALITVMEESGGIGVQNIPADFMKSSAFNITLDRMGDSDVVIDYFSSRLCPEPFSREIMKIASELGIELTETLGTFADTYYISLYTPGVNLSVGYYRPHMPGDFVHVAAAANAMAIAERIIQDKDRLLRFAGEWYKKCRYRREYEKEFADDYIDDIIFRSRPKMRKGLY